MSWSAALTAVLLSVGAAEAAAPANLRCPEGLADIDQRLAQLEQRRDEAAQARVGELRNLRDTARRLNEAGNLDGCASVVAEAIVVADRGQGPPVRTASALMGTKVIDTAGKDLGEIKEVIVDPASGRLAYAVIGVGGWLTMGGDMVAVPWSLLQMQPDGERMTLPVERARLENAPRFDRNSWPEMADRQWGDAVHAYYGVAPYWATASSGTAASAATSDVAATQAADTASQMSGTVDQLRGQVEALSRQMQDLARQVGDLREAQATSDATTGPTASSPEPATPPTQQQIQE